MGRAECKRRSGYHQRSLIQNRAAHRTPRAPVEASRTKIGSRRLGKGRADQALFLWRSRPGRQFHSLKEQSKCLCGTLCCIAARLAGALDVSYFVCTAALVAPLKIVFIAVLACLRTIEVDGQDPRRQVFAIQTSGHRHKIKSIYPIESMRIFETATGSSIIWSCPPFSVVRTVHAGSCINLSKYGRVVV